MVFLATAADLTSPRQLPVYQEKDAYMPVAAFGGGVYLVVWQAGRLDTGDIRLGPKYHSVLVGMRLDASGEPLDTAPFLIADTADIREMPYITYGNGVFLVVWHDLRSGADWDVYASRITAEGLVKDPNGFPVIRRSHNQARPKAVWDGVHFVVVWQDARSGLKYETFLSRVTSKGVVLDTGGVSLATGPSNIMCPAIAPTKIAGRSLAFSIGATNQFWGWYALYSPTTARFVNNGIPEATAAYSVTDGGTVNPVGKTFVNNLAMGKETYLLAWKNDNPAGRGNTRLKQNMAVFDSAGNRLYDLYIGSSVLGTDKWIIDPSVAWGGNGYVVSWFERMKAKSEKSEYNRVYAAVISEQGTLLDSVKFVAGSTNAPAAQPWVASDGEGNALVVFEKHPLTADTPIVVGYRMMTTSPISGTQETSLMVERYPILSAYPNPFKPSLHIGIHQAASPLSVEIYDTQGKKVADLSSRLKIDKGSCSAVWDASGLASGLYVVKMQSGSRSIFAQRVLLK